MGLYQDMTDSLDKLESELTNALARVAAAVPDLAPVIARVEALTGTAKAVLPEPVAPVVEPVPVDPPPPV